MSTDQLSVEAEEVPPRLSSNPFGMDRTDWWFTGTMGAIAFITQTLTNSLGFMVVLILWLILMKRLLNRRIYRVPGTKLQSFWQLRVKKGNVYPPKSRRSRRSKSPVAKSEDAATSDPKQKGKAAKKTRQPRRWPIPFVVNSVPTPDGQGNIGVLHTPMLRSDTILFSGGGADIASLDPVGQKQRLDQLAALIKQAAGQQGNFGIGVSMVFRNDPFDKYRFEAEQENLLHPQAVIPSAAYKQSEELTDEEVRWAIISDNLALVREDLEQVASEPRMLICLTIRREGLGVSDRIESLSTKEAKRLPINRIARDVSMLLERAGVSDPYVLNKAEAHEVVRGAWDTVGINRYYEALVSDPATATSPTLHWPSTMAAYKGYSRSDDTYCAVLRVTSQPNLVWSGYYRSVMGKLPVEYGSMAMVGETVRGRNEEFGLDRMLSAFDRLFELMGTTRQSLKTQDRLQRMEKRQSEIHVSQFAQDYSIVFAVRAPDEESLEAEVETLEHMLKGEGLLVNRIVEPIDQYNAMWAATLGLPLL